MKKHFATLNHFALVTVLNASVALLFFTVSLPVPTVRASPVPSPPAKPKAIAATTGIPSRIQIEAMAIDLDVKTGSFDPQTSNWTIDLTGAYYADSSMPINNSNGVTLIYGHAQSEVFARLPDMPPDTRVSVTTDNGYLFTYRFISQRQVQPNDVSVFTAAGPPTLVLQTCVGVFSELRALLYFELEKIDLL